MAIKSFIKNHNSFAVIIIGAIAIFVANILLKKVFSPIDYGEYSLYITYIQLMGSFGLLGFEQVFLRISNVDEKNNIQTNKTLFIILFVVWILVGIVCAIVFKNYFSDIDIALIYIVITTLVITFSKFSYNIFRLNSDFVTSQLVLNFWRFFVGIITISFLVMKWQSISVFVKYLSLFLLVFLLVQIFYVINKINFKLSIEKSFGEISNYAFHFLIALLIVSLIAYGDRFFIKKHFGGALLGEYFYLLTIFLLPFSIMQGYIGFKELVAFKKEATMEILYQKLLKLNLFGITMAVLIVLATLFINQFDIIAHIGLHDHKVLVIVFLLTGIVKLNYSLYSALLGAQANPKTIMKVNIQSLIFLAITILISFSFIRTVEHVALLVFVFWLVRTLIYNYNLKKQL